MLYRKNIYTWEQIVRIVLSLAVVAYALVSMPAGLLSYGIALSAGGFALTGVFGWCPACAMVGRKLKS